MNQPEPAEAGLPQIARLPMQSQPQEMSIAKPGMPLATAFIWLAASVAAFHLAYAFTQLSFLIFAYLFALIQLTRVASGRQAFYFGLGAGMLTVAPQLTCFWVIFGPGAVALWMVLGFWIALFLTLSRKSMIQFGPLLGSTLLPFLWTGLEYFRSELYYLRFSWLNTGYTFAGTSLLPFCHWFGMYGVGFVAMACAGIVSQLNPKRGAVMAIRLSILGILALFFQAFGALERSTVVPGREIIVAGAQLEFETEAEVLIALQRLRDVEPNAELLVLSEYTFDGAVPEKIKDWCRKNQRYLVVGGKEPAPNSNFYNTAFVVGPTGEIVFKQIKSVPIQFFKDGLPADNQRLWSSPWGKIGICICYDLSYTRVTDRLIELGARAIIVPTMDVKDWGKHQHELHARVAPVRAAEYGVPVFRVASSGISQLIDPYGHELARAPFPGPGAMLGGHLILRDAGTRPCDRWLSPFCVGVSLVLVALFALNPLIRRTR
jgi:apolipoprotein N-acyltransferase